MNKTKKIDFGGCFPCLSFSLFLSRWIYAPFYLYKSDKSIFTDRLHYHTQECVMLYAIFTNFIPIKNVFCASQYYIKAISFVVYKDEGKIFWHAFFVRKNSLKSFWNKLSFALAFYRLSLSNRMLSMNE